MQQIKKTPIVVNDSRGFYTSRVYGTLLTEAAALLDEGVDPQTIERAATMAGFPAPPLAMLDEVSLTLTQHDPQGDRRGRRAATASSCPSSPAPRRSTGWSTSSAGTGKAAGAGFYDYPADAQEAALARAARALRAAPASTCRCSTSRSGYLFRMALETARCFDEGVIDSAAAANIGSIMGIGFPPLYGGAVQYMQGYEGPAGPAWPDRLRRAGPRARRGLR